jgi:hypothetical protein
MPGIWKIYGSNDGSTWENINDASNTATKINSTYYSTNGLFTKSNINSSKNYLYFGLVVKELSTTNTDVLNFYSWQIYGVENISAQSDWNTTIIHKPDLSIYVTTTNANALNTRFFNNNGNNYGTITNFNNVS